MNALSRWIVSPAACNLATVLAGILLVHVGMREFGRRWVGVEAGTCEKGRKKLARKRLVGLLSLGAGAALLAAGFSSVDWNRSASDAVFHIIVPSDAPPPAAPKTY